MLAAPAAPQQLRATWPHPQALRPELCWNEPTDQGGGGQDAVKIEKYLIWMHLMDGQVKLLDEVRDRLCFEVNLPEIFSSTFRFSVTAMNQVYEGLRSNILELATSGPPGTPGPIQIENLTNDLILGTWHFFCSAIFYGFYPWNNKKVSPPGELGEFVAVIFFQEAKLRISLSWIPPTTRHVPWVFQIGVFLFQTKRIPRTLQRVMGNLFGIPITPTEKKNHL